MPLTNYGEPYMLQALFGGVTSALPTPSSGSWYVGLIKVKGTWTASTTASSGDLIIPTAFSSTNKIFRCTTAGTTGSSEPSWNTTANATTSDGTAVWTETTGYFYTSANAISNEVSGGSYARQTLTQSQGSSTWVQPTTPASAAPASTNYGTAVSFPASTASWGYVAGFFLSNVSSAGNSYAWNTLSNFVPILAAGMTLTLPSSTGVTVTLA